MNSNLVLIYDKRPEISKKYKKNLEQEHIAKAEIITDKNDFYNKLQNTEPEMVLISDSICNNFSEFCKEIRNLKLKFRPVIIILSKSSFDEDKLNALNSGADDFISEPVNSEEFIARIKAHLRRTLEENSSPETKLPNEEYAKKIIRRTINNSKSWAMLLTGLDNFQFYKEIYGDIPAQKVLQAFSAIIKSTMEYDDFSAQFSNDYFFILTSSYKAEKLSDYLSYAFDSIVERFYSDEDVKRGYILLHGENKAGCKIPFMSLSTGILNSELMQYATEIDAVNSLFKVQKLAKLLSGSTKVIDRPLLLGETLIKIINEKNVVIIEQDEDLAYLLETTFKIQGFNPTILNYYPETFEELVSLNPAIILLDSGHDENYKALKLCTDLKNVFENNVKIIFTDTKHEKEHILSSGADLYLPKPYELMELFRWVYKLSD